MKHVSNIAITTGFWLAATANSFAQSNAGQAAGQATGARQPGQTQGATGVNAATRGVPNNNPGAAAFGGSPWQFGGWNRSPWFADPRVRQELRLKSDQFDQLQNNYSRSWNVYDRGLAGLQNDLTDEQRGIQQRELGQTFQNEFSGSLDQLLADPAQRLRFGQLYLQYQGFNAFNDPTVQQRLNLTDRQQRQLSRLQQEWDEQMQALSQEFARERNGTARFYELRQQAGERIVNVLTDEQRRMWQQMLGRPFDFPPEVYFPPAEGNSPSDANPRAIPNQP
jgi:hypothetical protein